MAVAQLTCRHDIVTDGCDTVCRECGLIFEEEPMVVEVRISPPWNHITYQPRDYVDKKLVSLCGVEPLWLMGPSYDPGSRERALKAGLLKCRTWSKVYLHMKSLLLEKHYLKVGAFMGYPLHIPRWMRKAVFDLVYGGYPIQMLYLIWKMFQIHGQDTRAIPLRSSASTLATADKVWMGVCEEFGLPFMSTSPGLPTPWSNSP